MSGDLGNRAIWFETDASNTSGTRPSSAGTDAPSTIDDNFRAMMGALAREWDQSHFTVTTAGSSTVYTATYTVAPAAYYQGQTFSLIIDETCGAAPTVNVNGLGAVTVKKLVAGTLTSLAANDWRANDRVVLAYNTTGPVFVWVNKGAILSTVNDFRNFGGVGDFSYGSHTGTDNSAAFTAAFSALSDGDILWIPPGYYYTTAMPTTTKSISIHGESTEGVHIIHFGCDSIYWNLSAQERESFVSIYDITFSTINLGTKRCIRYDGLTSTGGNGLRLHISRCNFVGADWEDQAVWPANTYINTFEWKTAIALDNADDCLIEKCFSRGKERAAIDSFDTQTIFIDINATSECHVFGNNVARTWKSAVITGFCEGLHFYHNSFYANNRAIHAFNEGGNDLNCNTIKIESNHLSTHDIQIEIETGATDGPHNTPMIIGNDFVTRADNPMPVGHRFVKIAGDMIIIQHNHFNASTRIAPRTNGDAAVEITAGQWWDVSHNIARNPGTFLIPTTGRGICSDNKIAETYQFSTMFNGNPVVNSVIAHGNVEAVALAAEADTARAGGSATTIKLAAGASALDDYYNGQIIRITGGTSSGDTRIFSDYVGATQIGTVTVAFTATPDATSTYSIAEISGTASAGAASTITLPAARAVPIDDWYNGLEIRISSGTGVGQTRIITDFVGSTLVATVDQAWGTNPDNTSGYAISKVSTDGRSVANAVFHDFRVANGRALRVFNPTSATPLDYFIQAEGGSLAEGYASLTSQRLGSTTNQPLRLESPEVSTSTVAALPATARAGAVYFATNGRKNGEGGGAGTGVLVFGDGTAWRACDTGATVAA